MLVKQDKPETIPKVLKLLQKSFDGTILLQQDSVVLTLSREVGSGNIKYTELQSGLTTLDFNFTLYEEREIEIECTDTNNLQFLYCLNGNCFHKFGDELSSYTQIEQFQMAVLSCTDPLGSKILVQQGPQFTLNIIFVDRAIYFNRFNSEQNPFQKKFKKLLLEVNAPKFFHLGSYNLRISEQLKLLIGQEHENSLSESLARKGRYYIILAKHIEQFLGEVGNDSNPSGLLRKELKKISEISEFIIRCPEIQHSIKNLCAQSGLSPAKLQEGFKFMFQRTVSDYIRNVRLDKAEELLCASDLSISEVVYTIGLTSRSYFCKIFKRRFGCSPKEYKYKHQVA